MSRYVLDDLEQVAAELKRRASEINAWLDAVAGREPGTALVPDGGSIARAIAEVDLACYQALSSTAARLAGAAEALVGCARDVREVDAVLARRMCRWSG